MADTPKHSAFSSPFANKNVKIFFLLVREATTNWVYLGLVQQSNPRYSLEALQKIVDGTQHFEKEKVSYSSNAFPRPELSIKPPSPHTYWIGYEQRPKEGEEDAVMKGVSQVMLEISRAWGD